MFINIYNLTDWLWPNLQELEQHSRFPTEITEERKPNWGSCTLSKWPDTSSSQRHHNTVWLAASVLNTLLGICKVLTIIKSICWVKKEKSTSPCFGADPLECKNCDNWQRLPWNGLSESRSSMTSACCGIAFNTPSLYFFPFATRGTMCSCLLGI